MKTLDNLATLAILLGLCGFSQAGSAVVNNSKSTNSDYLSCLHTEYESAKQKGISHIEIESQTLQSCKATLDNYVTEMREKEAFAQTARPGAESLDELASRIEQDETAHAKLLIKQWNKS